MGQEEHFRDLQKKILGQKTLLYASKLENRSKLDFELSQSVLNLNLRS
jgi:hypothetical protein